MKDLFGAIPEKKISFREAMTMLRQRGWVVLTRVPKFPDAPRVKRPVERKTQRSHVQGRT